MDAQKSHVIPRCLLHILLLPQTAIVGYEVYEQERGELAAALLQRIVLNEQVYSNPKMSLK